MKKILVLGAGYVARPFVDYILKNTNFALIVADVDIKNAQRVTQNHARTEAQTLDIRENEKLEQLIVPADLTISLLPYAFHYQVARACVKLKTSLITASYLTPEINALEKAAKDAGILILKEMGLDPGIDHMSAMEIIDKIKVDGGRIRSFKSYCGGLAAPEANTNPWKYKFSWSPRGVLQAAQNGAKFLRDNRVHEIDSRNMLTQTEPLHVETFDLEAYPNRDSLAYIDRYGLTGIDTLIRYTLRFPGWVKTMAALRDIGLSDDNQHSTPQNLSRDKLLRNLLHVKNGTTLQEIFKQRAGANWDDTVEQRLSWLGLFDDEPENLPVQNVSPLDYLVKRMVEKMSFEKNERDMIILHHEFRFDKGDAHSLWESSLVEYGIPGGASAMARTVAYPAAIAARFVLEGKITRSGVHIPVVSDIYTPVLDELHNQGMVFSEKITEMTDNT